MHMVIVKWATRARENENRQRYRMYITARYSASFIIALRKAVDRDLCYGRSWGKRRQFTTGAVEYTLRTNLNKLLNTEISRVYRYLNTYGQFQAKQDITPKI